MAEIAINPTHNVFKKYKEVIYVNPFLANIKELRVNYTFNETSGTSLIDNSGLNNNGANQGVTINQIGKINKSYLFDGINDRVVIADNTSLQFGTDNFTVAFWINLNKIKSEPSAQNTVISKNYLGFEISVYLGKLLSYFGGANLNQSLPGVTTLKINEWNFVLFERNDTEIRFELNNVFESSKANIKSNVSNIGTAINLGWRPGGSNLQYFDGKIDAIKLYKGVLTQVEKNELWNNGNGIE